MSKEVRIANLSQDDIYSVTAFLANKEYANDQMKEIKELCQINENIILLINEKFPKECDKLNKIRIINKAKKYDLNEEDLMLINNYQKVEKSEEDAIYNRTSDGSYSIKI